MAFGNGDDKHPQTPLGAASAPDSFLSRKKQQILLLSMALLGRRVDQWLDTAAAAGRKRSRAVDDHDSAAEDLDGPATTKTTTPNWDDAAGKDKAGGKAKKRTKRDDEHAGPLLACPFHQHDPENYGRVKTCLGPGWPKAHRVKEHVYRNHELPQHMCPRCFESFASASLLNRHQREEPPCEVNKAKAPDGFDAEQKALLHKRTSGASEMEKWRNMYRVLFPDDSEIPSPYYKHVAATVQPVRVTEYMVHGMALPKDGYPAHDVASSRDFLKSEIMRIAKPMIEVEIELQLKRVQDEVNTKVVEILTGVQNKVMRTFAFVSDGCGDEHVRQQTDTSKGPAPTTARPVPEVDIPGLENVLEDPAIAGLFYGSDFDFNAFECQASMDFGGIPADSAYFTSSLSSDALAM